MVQSLPNRIRQLSISYLLEDKNVIPKKKKKKIEWQNKI